MKHLLCLFAATFISQSATALRVVTPKTAVDFSTTDIMARNLKGQRTFSLKETLFREWGPSCKQTNIKVTPLSLVGDVLSLQLDGSICGEDGTWIRAFHLNSAEKTVTLSDFVGTASLVNALKRDPYLKANLNLEGQSLIELDFSATQRTVYPQDGCQFSPSPISLAASSFAWWEVGNSTVNARLAMPLSCGMPHQVNDYQWIGLSLPLPQSLKADLNAAKLGKGFLAAQRPKVAVIIQRR